MASLFARLCLGHFSSKIPHILIDLIYLCIIFIIINNQNNIDARMQ